MGLLQDEVDGIRALRMAVKIPQKKGGVATPLFKLELGVASSSAGLVCARMAGVKSAVLERAREIIDAGRENRKIQPLAEILRGHLEISARSKRILGRVLSSNWNKASENEIHGLMKEIQVSRDNAGNQL